MFIFFRGFGFLVPIVVLLLLAVAAVGLNSPVGDALYEANVSIYYVAIVVAAVVLVGLGYRLNIKPLFEQKLDHNVGFVHRESSSFRFLWAGRHSLFMVPIQYWSFIILLMLAFHYEAANETDAISAQYVLSPQVGDIYLTDFDLLYDDYYDDQKYGAVKVIDVDRSKVTFMFGNYSMYEQESVVISLLNGFYFPEASPLDFAVPPPPTEATDIVEDAIVDDEIEIRESNSDYVMELTYDEILDKYDQGAFWRVIRGEDELENTPKALVVIKAAIQMLEYQLSTLG